MAGPQVTLTFAGDTKQLDTAFSRVGESAERMGRDVGDSSQRVGRDMGSGFDRGIEKADLADTRMMGFRDTVTGVGDTMRGFTDDSLSMEERLLMLGMGAGDLASAFANLLLPAAKNVANFLKGGLLKAMTFVSAHPLLIVLGLLAAAFVLLWMNSETFREIVKDVFNNVRDFVVDAFNAIVRWGKQAWENVTGFVSGAKDRITAIWRGAVDWVVRKAGEITDWFRNLPGRIGSFLSGVKDTLLSPFRAGVDAIKNLWNNTIGGFGFTLPGFLGGGEINIPRLHQGGIVPGAPGTETLAMLQAGERVVPRGQASAGGRTVIEVRSGGTRLDDALVELLRGAIRTRGGDVQAVLGQA